MGGLIIFIVVMVVISLVLRLLREMFKWVDYVAWAFVAIGLLMFILGWINAGFWTGLLSGGTIMLVTGWMFGLGENTIERNGTEGTLDDCKKCNYNKVRIIEDYGDYFITQCPRCGKKKLLVDYCEECHSKEFKIDVKGDYVIVICKRCGHVKRILFND